MTTKYIIDNLAEQTISGSLSATTISADTLYVSGNSVSNPYKVYTAFYNVEETILKVYQNTLGTISFSYDSGSNILRLTSDNLFGTSDNSTPDKFYGIASVVDYGFSNLFLRTQLINPSLIQITDGTSNNANMTNGSLKFFLELRVYN